MQQSISQPSSEHLPAPLAAEALTSVTARAGRKQAVLTWCPLFPPSLLRVLLSSSLGGVWSLGQAAKGSVFNNSSLGVILFFSPCCRVELFEASSFRSSWAKLLYLTREVPERRETLLSCGASGAWSGCSTWCCTCGPGGFSCCTATGPWILPGLGFLVMPECHQWSLPGLLDSEPVSKLRNMFPVSPRQQNRGGKRSS